MAASSGQVQTKTLSLATSMKLSKSPSTRPDKPDNVINIGEEIVSISNLKFIPPGFPINVQEEMQPVDHRKYSFLTVTSKGRVSLWRWMGQYKLWEVKLALTDVVFGEIYSNLHNTKSILYAQCRKQGLLAYLLTHDFNVPSIVTNVKLSQPIHIGFCKMGIMSYNETVPLLVLPIGLNSFGLMKAGPMMFNFEHENEVESDQPLDSLLETRHSIMFLHCYKYENVHGILYGLEDGTVKAADVHWCTSYDIQPWSSEVQLNSCCKDEESMLLPISGIFSDKHQMAVIGTSSKSLCILKCVLDNKTIYFERRKTLINKGLECMSLHSEGNLMVTGGWDGVIRLFELPSMNQVMSIKFHEQQLRVLHFIPFERKCQSRHKYFLLCGAADGVVSSWNLYPSIKDESRHISL